jgi:excisionase family DNA binding protein
MTAAPGGPLLLTGLKDISRALGCGRWEALTLIREGGLPARRIGRSWHVSRRALEAWADAMSRPPGRGPGRRG